MKYRREDYTAFLNEELAEQIAQFSQLINTKATLLKDRDSLFVGRFLKVDKSGIAIFKIKDSGVPPRKNTFWAASILIGNMASPKNWGDLSWADLRNKYQKDFSEAQCIWISKADEPDFCLIGIKRLSLDFVAQLEEGKTVVTFGPKEPPYKYFQNLIDISQDDSALLKPVLDYSEQANQWQPVKVEAKADFNAILLKDLETNDYIRIQGPPGTGKTYRMAQLIARLLNEGKSILATSLTNQALMELAQKEDLLPFLKKGMVSKTSLTTDESKQLKDLFSIKDNLCNAANGHLSLATFYISSEWAKEAQEPPFDYVIMDESSQAFLPMIAAVLKLGKKVIWIGDQNQLSPISMINEDRIREKSWEAIKEGFVTLCDQFSYPAYMLSDTFRLSAQGAAFTGLFYNNELDSVAEVQKPPIELAKINKDGAPSLLVLDLKIGDKKSSNGIDEIRRLAHSILEKQPKAKIAILSKFRESINEIQKVFIQTAKSIPDNLIINTIDSVQGLTVDYTLFFIPNASVDYSLDRKLFNVATSRARYATIIIADKGIFNKDMDDKVRQFLLKTQKDSVVIFEEASIPPQNIKGLKIVGKIDLTPFEKKKPVYIIDTNIFIDCPDIISRIKSRGKIVIPTTVIEELDKLKQKKEIDKQVLSQAIKNINRAFGQNKSTMESSSLDLLPEGFDKSNPDCMIFSVALKYKEETPILLTSDNNLKARAKGMGIKVMSLNNILKKV